MSLSMHKLASGAFNHMLGALSKNLAKAEAHAVARKIDPARILDYRLAPDMFALTRQVQIATDFAKGTMARLAGVEPPKFEDNEATVAQLQERINKTLAYVNSVGADAFTGAEDRTVTIKVGPQDMSFPGSEYFAHFAMPNFYFHVTTAYNIMRHAGVELGKRDFMGRA